MRKIAILLAVAVTLIVISRPEPASARYITPTYASDFDAFVIFLWAEERCPGIKINYDKTLEQIGDLGDALGWDRNRTGKELQARAQAARAEVEKDLPAFCDKARSLFRSYDPAHLLKVGVTFGI